MIGMGEGGGIGRQAGRSGRHCQGRRKHGRRVSLMGRRVVGGASAHVRWSSHGHALTDGGRRGAIGSGLRLGAPSLTRNAHAAAAGRIEVGAAP